MEELNKRIQECQACSISKDKVNVYNKEMGYGKLPVKAGKNKGLIVGINPSVSRFPDTIEKGAFYGRTAGDVLTKVLKEAGFNKDNFAITNLVKCSTPHNRTLTQKEIDSCAYFLFQEIEITKPRVIIPLGVEVIEFFNGTMFKVRQWYHKDNRYMIFCMPHPGYLKYRPDLRREYISHLVKLKDLL